MFEKNLLSKINPDDAEQMHKVAQGILSKMEKEGLSLREAIGVDDDLLEEVYALAYAHYNQGKYKESLSLFHFLMGVAPFEYKYLLGLGASFHQLKDYENAIFAFFTAWHLDTENPTPPYYIADSFVKMGDTEEAIEFFNSTIEILEETGKDPALKERCKLTLEGLQKNKK